MASDVSVECGTLAMRYVEKLKSLITHAVEVSKRHDMLVEPNVYYLAVKSLDEAVDELIQKTGKTEKEALLDLREEFRQIRAVAESLLIVATLALHELDNAKRAT
jgi:DNA-binding transcriptional regulator WhiA